MPDVEPRQSSDAPSASFPQLRSAASGAATALTGRIITIGSSPGCRVRVPGIPPASAHLIFVKGSYHLQVMAPNAAIAVNGAAVIDNAPLRHGDRVTIGSAEFRFLERDETTAPAATGSSDLSMVSSLITGVVALLRNRGDAVFAELVASVARLLRCDAARLVVERNGERTTLARFPQSSSLDRFSSRAIDWARDAAHTVLAHDDQWQGSAPEQTSLERNLVSSILCAPLREGDDVLGYLYLDRLSRTEQFTESDRAFCDSLLPLFSEILGNDRERQRQRDAIALLQQERSAETGGMVFGSEAMGAVVQLAGRLALADSPVLILGETGTGKELMARFIHRNSRRSDKPFRAINCGAIPENLIESELFGHEKGAFTGASQRRVGLFESAQGGTVLLDEIGELPPLLQVKLLRVLQEGEVTRVGGNDPVRVDVRVIAATNRDLKADVDAGRFRQDLYFRINVLALQLPPLRDRGEDVCLLADFLVKKYCQQFGLPEKQLSAAARSSLTAHAWPGNVRELENVIQKAILLSTGTRIQREDLAAVGTTGEAESGFVTIKQARSAAERDVIARALARTKGNVSLTAKQLDIDRKWLMKMMEELKISADEYRE